MADKTIIAAIDAQVASEEWQQAGSDPGMVVIYNVAIITETHINTLAVVDHGVATVEFGVAMPPAFHYDR